MLPLSYDHTAHPEAPSTRAAEDESRFGRGKPAARSASEQMSSSALPFSDAHSAAATRSLERRSAGGQGQNRTGWAASGDGPLSTSLGQLRVCATSGNTAPTSPERSPNRTAIVRDAAIGAVAAEDMGAGGIEAAEDEKKQGGSKAAPPRRKLVIHKPCDEPEAARRGEEKRDEGRRGASSYAQQQRSTVFLTGQEEAPTVKARCAASYATLVVGLEALPVDSHAAERVGGNSLKATLQPKRS